MMKSLLTTFQNLSPGDRRALSVLAAFSLVMIVVFGGLGLRSMSTNANREAAQAEKQYRDVLTLAEDFAMAKAQKEALQRRIKSSRVQLESDIEAAASSLDIDIHDMKNQSPVPSKGDSLREERLRITVKAITMDRFTELMGKLLDHRSGDLVRVREISLKTQFGDNSKVKAIFVMSTWRRNG
jgi:hypothetical protein